MINLSIDSILLKIWEYGWRKELLSMNTKPLGNKNTIISDMKDECLVRWEICTNGRHQVKLVSLSSILLRIIFNETNIHC